MIKQLELFNYGPFKGRHLIDFAGREGVILISGIYDDNPERSNQSGKSWVMGAIRYLLFGKFDVSREIKLIHERGNDIEKEMWVKGVVELAGQTLTIERGRTAKNEGKFSVEGWGGQRDEQEGKLRSLLGITYDDYMATYYFKQGDINAFMSATNKEKKVFLKRWLDFTRWDKYAERDKLHSTEAKSKVESLQAKLDSYSDVLSQEIDTGQILTLQQERAKRDEQLKSSLQRGSERKTQLDNLPSNKEILQKLTDAVQALNELKGQRDQLETSVAQAQTAIQEAEGRVEELSTLNNVEHEIEEQKQALTEYDQKIETVASQIQDLEQQLHKLRDSYIEIHSMMRQQAASEAEVNTKLKEKNGLLDKIVSLGDHCPFDQKPCNRIGPEFQGHLTAETEELNQSLGTWSMESARLAEREAAIKGEDQTLQQQIGTKKTEALNLNNYRKNQASVLEGVHQKINRKNYLAGQSTPQQAQEALDAFKPSIEDLGKRIVKALEVMTAAQQESQVIDSIESQRIEVHEAIEKEKAFQTQLSQRVSEIDKDIGAIEERKRLQEEARKQQATIQVELGEAQTILSRWQYLEAVHGKEIPSILTENAFEEVENEVNFVLKGLHCGMRIQFSATRELTTKEDVCSICGTPFPKRVQNCQNCGFGVRKKKQRDELTLEVFQGSTQREFAQVSGGGQVLISMSLRIALSKLLQRKKASQVDFLQMDEVFGMLDPVNRSNTVRMIFDVLLNVLGFKQVIVISHTDAGSSGYNVLQVTRYEEEERSTVGWV